MKLFLILAILSAFSANVYALDSARCSSFVYGNGWFRKYPGLGMGEAGMNNMTRTTSKGSTIKGTSDYSSQFSTASTDPGVSSKATQSFTQSASSWGACKLIGSAQELRELRELYYAQNKDDFLKELAQGNGGHLEVMAFFGRCNMEAQSEFNSTMQGHYGELIQKVQNDKEFMDKFDSYLQTLNCQIG